MADTSQDSTRPEATTGGQLQSASLLVDSALPFPPPPAERVNALSYVLSESELAIVQRLADGRPLYQVAEELGIGWPTVNTYLRRARKKLRCASNIQLALLVYGVKRT